MGENEDDNGDGGIVPRGVDSSSNKMNKSLPKLSSTKQLFYSRCCECLTFFVSTFLHQ